jgi:hypothetical protein
MLDAAVCTSASHESRRRVVEAGALHGTHRREQELTIDVLLDEHNALRNAVWHYLSRRLGDVRAGDALSEIVRFDATATFVVMASLRGYHRIEIERDRDWNREIDQIVSDWEETSLTGQQQAAAGG